MKVFATQYALTKGILEIEGEISSVCPDIFCENKIYSRYFHGEGKDWHHTREAAVKRANQMRVAGEGKNWHRTREAAVKRANQMRVAKIASLKKQIAELEAQAFK